MSICATKHHNCPTCTCAEQQQGVSDSAALAGYALTCDPSAQIAAWVNGTKDQWDFWTEVVRGGTFSGLDKTLEEAQALVNYFEGQYDMALKVRQFINEKTVSA